MLERKRTAGSRDRFGRVARLREMTWNNNSLAAIRVQREEGMASGIHSNSRVGKTSLDPHCLAEPRSTEVAGSCGRLVLHTPTLLAGVVDRHQSESGERGREGEGAEVQPQSFLHQLRSPRLPRLLRQGSPAPALYCLQVSALITEASSEEPRRKSVLPPWQYLLHSANSFFVPPRLRPSSGKFSSKSSLQAVRECHIVQ